MNPKYHNPPVPDAAHSPSAFFIGIPNGKQHGPHYDPQQTLHFDPFRSDDAPPSRPPAEALCLDLENTEIGTNIYTD